MLCGLFNSFYTNLTVFELVRVQSLLIVRGGRPAALMHLAKTVESLEIIPNITPMITMAIQSGASFALYVCLCIGICVLNVLS